MSDKETYNWCALFCGGNKFMQDDNIIVKRDWKCNMITCKEVLITEKDSTILHKSEYLCYTPICLEKQYKIDYDEKTKTTNYNCPCYQYKKIEKINEPEINIGHSKDNFDSNKKIM